MDIKIKRIALVIVTTQLFLANSCTKHGTKPCVEAVYSFNVTGDFSPEQEIYNIGDTIVFTSSFPKQLYDLITNKQIDYSNSVSIGGTVNFLLMDTVINNVIESFSKFQLVPKIGDFSQIANVPETGINSNYFESGNFEFKVGIIVKQKGIFIIGVNNLGSQGIRGDNCTNAGFNMTVTNVNKHFNLFQYALGYAADIQQINHGYCFRVQ